MDFEVIVVGAGPAGASAAETCAQEGLRVALLEKKEQPGMKICAGGLDHRILREFYIDQNIIQCHTRRYRFYAPSKKRSLTEDIESATVYRKDFDRYLVHRAVDAGATLLLLTHCQGVLRNDHKVVGVAVKTPKGLGKLYGKIVIAADGFFSTTARSAGLQERYHSSEFGVATQFETQIRSKTTEDTKHIFYGKDISPCGFGWIYPKRYGYTVGLGSIASRIEKGQLARNLKYLVEEHPIASEILSKMIWKSSVQVACLPLKPSSKICGDGILVAGDAAGQVSPLGGNGIYYAMKAGTEAGRVATDAATDGDTSLDKLREYQETCFSLFGDKFNNQRRILEMIEANYNTYMEAQILLKNHPITKRIYNAGIDFAKLFFK